MVNTLTVLKSIHVLAATLWIGGNFVINVLFTLAFGRGDRDQQLFLMRSTEFIGQRLFTPLALIVVGMGIWLTAKYYDFGEYWISYGLGAFVVSFVAGFFFLGPRSGALAAKLEEGADEATIARMARPVMTVARLDLLLLSSIVVMMVIRPG